MSHPIKTQFSITHWHGKRFPSDCLLHADLEYYCERLRAIPTHSPIKCDLSVHLPIQKFLSSTFPSHDHSLVTEAASHCFSDNLPNEILTSLAERDIPPQKFIQDAKSHFGQAVLDCRRSIRDPLHEKSFLPFWVITLWEWLAELNVARKEWASATAWFQRLSKTLGPTTSATTGRHFTRVGWGAGITIGQERATALTLPQLLSDACLNSTVLDLMAECTQVEVSYGAPAHAHICGTLFATKVTQLRRCGETPPDWFRKRFIDPVEKRHWKILYFPMFWPKHKHWVSVRVDFTTERVSVGR